MSTAAVSTSGPEGMPASYSQSHGREERMAHAAIVGRRGGALVHVEQCPGPVQKGAPTASWLCVVTDDRPGLLSLLSAAIGLHSLDIHGARIYCRRRPGHADEAVDLFAVRDPRGLFPALTLHRIAGVRATAESLLRGDMSLASVERRAASTARAVRPQPLSVCFEGETDVLIVEAGDRPGLLLAITLAIFKERLTIVRSHVSTSAANARDEFELAEIDGRRLSVAMRKAIVEKVREALEEPARGDAWAQAVPR